MILLVPSNGFTAGNNEARPIPLDSNPAVFFVRKGADPSSDFSVDCLDDVHLVVSLETLR